MQNALAARSNGTRRPRSRTTSLLTGVAYCAGCGGRMYFAARKAYPYGGYLCRATARGEMCSAPAGMRSDRLEEYAPGCCGRAGVTEVSASREDLLRDDVRVVVAKGHPGGGPKRLAGPEASRPTFTVDGSLSGRPEH